MLGLAASCAMAGVAPATLAASAIGIAAPSNRFGKPFMLHSPPMAVSLADREVRARPASPKRRPSRISAGPVAAGGGLVAHAALERPLDGAQVERCRGLAGRIVLHGLQEPRRQRLDRHDHED